MFDTKRFYDAARADLDAFAVSRKRDVARGAETSELAGLLVQKYGYGLAKAVRLASELADHPAPDLIADVDRAVADIDPDWRANQVRRFESRPASVSFTKND